MREAMEGFREMTSEEIRAKLRLDERILYEPDPSRPGGLIRILPDGTRQPGFRKGNAFVEGGSWHVPERFRESFLRGGRSLQPIWLPCLKLLS